MVGACVLTDKPVLDLRWRLSKGRLLSKQVHLQKEGSATPKSPGTVTRCCSEESGKCFIQWINLTTAFRKYILSYCQANCLSLFLTFWLSDILRVRIFAWRQVSKAGA